MTIRRPTERTEDIRDSVFDLIEWVTTLPRIEVKQIDVTAVASTTVTVPLTSGAFTKLDGAIQMKATCDEVAYVRAKNTQSVDVSWDFGASTSGKQTVTFLLIGS